MNIFRRYTLKSLWQNKVRTCVTIVGIILSVAMITAVTTTVSSLQNFMVEVTVQNDGCWHASFIEEEEHEIEDVLNKPEVDRSAEYADIAYARLDTVKKERSPYLYIGGFSEPFSEFLTVNIKEGRLPENSHELILPADMAEASGISYEVGQTIELETGVRQENATGESMWEDSSFSITEDLETFVADGISRYEIVGFYESAQFGYWGSFQGLPGYPALTRLDENAVIRGRRMVYMTMKDPEQAGDFVTQLQKEYGEVASLNRFYLKISGSNLGDSVLGMLIGLVSVLLGIIMIGSIAMICNSFAISVNERKKQYGLLSSIGATRRQLKKSVFFEAVVVSLVGIPLGVLAGIGGMAVTFYCLQDTFEVFLNSGNVRLHASAAFWSVALAAVVGFITVLISAYLPMRKALKINAIEAIRQTTDIVIKPKKLKTSRLTVKLFGLEGVLASKNYKRSKRKYRATIFSLFISVVLFVSASSFSSYLSRGFSDMIGQYSCDIEYIDACLWSEKDAQKYENLYQELSQASGVTEAYYNFGMWSQNILTVAGKYITDSEYRNILGEDKPEDAASLEEPVELQVVSVCFVQDDVYKEYLESHHLDVDRYMDAENPTAIVYDKMIVYDAEEERFENIHVFEKNPGTVQLSFEVWPEEEWDEDASEYVYEEEVDEPTILDGTELRIGEIREDTPPGMDIHRQSGCLFIYPASALDAICPVDVRKELTMGYTMDFYSNNPDDSEQAMQDLLDEQENYGALINIATEVKVTRALMTVINIFSFGFIILISLIAMANVFNTISTNIFLRKREFAMLRSVGMTQKSFRKMTNFECLLYGVKGLVYGLPVAVIITALIWRVMNSEVVVNFYIPWYSIAIAVASVFLVVFATMLYSMSKIKKDNVVETLKEETY